MSYDHLYRPEPCSAWSVAELCVRWARRYRQAGGRGLDGPAYLEVALDAHLAAGGSQHGAVRDMIASLSREHGDCLQGPAQAWRDWRQTPEVKPPADADLFEPEERHA